MRRQSGNLFRHSVHVLMYYEYSCFHACACKFGSFLSGKSHRKFRDKQGWTQRSCHVTDGVLRIHSLLHSVRDAGYRLLQQPHCRLRKLVLPPLRCPHVQQQLHQPFHLSIINPFIYAAKYREFQQGARRLLSKMRLCPQHQSETSAVT